MCKNPSFVWVQRGPGYEQVPVPCKDCWQCRQNKVDDFVGRCLAEASTSAHACTITLTYAPRDDLADKVVTPQHFQVFMKALRNAGHKVRYFVAGEYGEEKARAHFHAILFFTHIEPSGKAVPGYRLPNPFCLGIPQMDMVHIHEWPHGHVQVDWGSSERSIRYVAKYLLTDKKTGWISMSKKPPLGAVWFAAKAQQSIDAGVMPSSFDYLPPGGQKERRYLMSGATRRDYLKRISDDLQRPDYEFDEWVLKSMEKVRKWSRLREASDITLAEWEQAFLDLNEANYRSNASAASRAAFDLLLDRFQAQFERVYTNDELADMIGMEPLAFVRRLNELHAPILDDMMLKARVAKVERFKAGDFGRGEEEAFACWLETGHLPGYDGSVDGPYSV